VTSDLTVELAVICYLPIWVSLCPGDLTVEIVVTSDLTEGPAVTCYLTVGSVMISGLTI
jgi:hypothetical protein